MPRSQKCKTKICWLKTHGLFRRLESPEKISPDSVLAFSLPQDKMVIYYSDVSRATKCSLNCLFIKKKERVGGCMGLFICREDSVWNDPFKGLQFFRKHVSIERDWGRLIIVWWWIIKYGELINHKINAPIISYHLH